MGLLLYHALSSSCALDHSGVAENCLPFVSLGPICESTAWPSSWIKELSCTDRVMFAQLLPSRSDPLSVMAATDPMPVLPAFETRLSTDAGIPKLTASSANSFNKACCLLFKSLGEILDDLLANLARNGRVTSANLEVNSFSTCSFSFSGLICNSGG